MNKTNPRTDLLSNAPVPKALLAMGLPTMLGMMISALYNLVDAYFVGGLGTSRMGAISVAYPLGQVTVGLGLLFGSGAASVIARALGRGDREWAGQAASTAVYGGLAIGGAAIALALLFLEPLLRLLGATDSILPYAMRYAGIYVAGSLFNVFNVTMNSVVTSEGAAKTSMAAMSTGAVLNMALDPLFIFAMNMDVTGAAVATALSQMASSLIYLRYIFCGRSLFAFSARQCRFTGKMLSPILAIGVPALVFQLLSGLVISLTNAQAAPYGDSVIAGMGAVNRVTSLGTLMVFGFIKGFQPIAGYSYGAGDYARMREATRTAILWTTAFCAALGLAMLIFPENVISLFTKADRAMIRAGARALRANGLSVLLFGFYTVYSSLFLALGKAKEGLFLGACRQGLCFAPMIWLLPALWGMDGVLYAQPAADAMAALIAGAMAARLSRQLKRV
ncbi:MAG: MATE family efflux transporter [Clostridiales bacterium]|nr:MATE family efflux transporter [Clostridiales bacterium]MDO4349793.1 MATE family efflux transporter [Eubacteriales bacterium]MDY4008045.1 MATE family efflux transporter [Candidatus Limiplasma sp.]